MGKWKAIGANNKMRLYDLSKDIAEEHDLAAQHPDIVRRMGQIMQEAHTAPRSQKDDGKYTGKGPQKKKAKG